MNETGSEQQRVTAREVLDQLTVSDGELVNQIMLHEAFPEIFPPVFAEKKKGEFSFEVEQIQGTELGMFLFSQSPTLEQKFSVLLQLLSHFELFVKQGLYISDRNETNVIVDHSLHAWHVDLELVEDVLSDQKISLTDRTLGSAQRERKVADFYNSRLFRKRLEKKRKLDQLYASSVRAYLRAFWEVVIMSEDVLERIDPQKIIGMYGQTKPTLKYMKELILSLENHFQVNSL